ncbi:tryptophan--tRNA ligase [Falseniella ignava]|uniref:Tryptophan--tRNA ligase n=1 Tax=Falseniella ignava CCUG 37419 TaxID=883112 RepID=K1LNG2_9LACT|nr:tryptophan--tRNA ligase [Falseniella ignava]EKB53657.1 tryptophan-tRNA ligase [Falseniella ignava CCUG 37419]
MKPRVFSGVQPTGTPTIGNYVGAMKGFVELQSDYDTIYCVANQHAITVPQDPKLLRQRTRELAALYLAIGINPEQSIMFVQSDVPAHAQVAWIIQCLTPLGELERMTQYKDKATKQDNVNAGLLNYPALMVGDIILYDAAHVPVGDDQKQHLELARNFVDRFNNRFGELLVKPEPMIPKAGARIMSLQDPTRKMSKSDDNARSYILLLDEPKKIIKKVKSAVTDTIGAVNYDPENQPAITNLINIYARFSGLTPEQIVADYQGKGYGDFKGDVAEAIVSVLEPIQDRYHQLLQSDELDEILAHGAIQANEIANATLTRIEDAIGFNYR